MAKLSSSPDRIERGRLGVRLAKLTIYVLLPTTLCQSQVQSCKVVADASNLLARTPHHVYSSDVSGRSSTDSESISNGTGIYWKARGVWHRSASSMQQDSQETAEANLLLKDCRQVADETIDGQPTAMYSAHDGGSGATETVWIAKKSGRILKSEVLIGSKRISSHIEYGDIQTPPDVR